MVRRAAARSSEKSDRPMVTIYDREGNPFTTGDLATLNSLLCDGYTLDDGTTQAEAVDKLTATESDAAGG